MRERKEKKELRKRKLCVYPYIFPIIRHFTSLYFASLYFTIVLSNAAKNYIHTYLHGFTYLYLTELIVTVTVTFTVHCLLSGVLYICRYGRYNCIDRIESRNNC